MEILISVLVLLMGSRNAISDTQCEDLILGTKLDYCQDSLETGNEFILLAVERSQNTNDKKKLDNALLCADIAFNSYYKGTLLCDGKDLSEAQKGRKKSAQVFAKIAQLFGFGAEDIRYMLKETKEKANKELSDFDCMN